METKKEIYEKGLKSAWNDLQNEVNKYPQNYERIKYFSGRYNLLCEMYLLEKFED